MECESPRGGSTKDAVLLKCEEDEQRLSISRSSKGVGAQWGVSKIAPGPDRKDGAIDMIALILLAQVISPEGQSVSRELSTSAA